MDITQDEIDFNELTKLTNDPIVKDQHKGSLKLINKLSSFVPKMAFPLSQPLAEPKAEAPYTASKQTLVSTRSDTKMSAFLQKQKKRDVASDRPISRQFIDLMINVRRCRPTVFLCIPPPKLPPQPFRFETPEPIVFDNKTSQNRPVKVKAGALPKAKGRVIKPSRFCAVNGALYCTKLVLIVFFCLV